ncbi:MAG TPA: DUF3253 domain-containing protein [Acidimicrobiales bacterium]|nr:DUF3253 domain-containing protein [Acidimicrobiales bacterium]
MEEGVDPWVVLDGRRWRRTDPSIPDALRGELVKALMAARRVTDRPRTHDAKIALGERGPRWWEAPTEAGDRVRLTAAIRVLLHHRGPEKTICPSDAARVAGGGRWRALVPLARQVAAELARDGEILVTQRGEALEPDPVTWKGPVRLRLR